MRAADAAAEAPLLLTIDQGAAALAVSSRTIENLIRRGDLASLRIGRARRLTRSALTHYVARLEAEQLTHE